MNRESALLHVRSAIEEVAEEHGISEAVLYAAMNDDSFLESAVTRLLSALPADGHAGMPAFDEAAAEFSVALQPEALALLQRYQKLSQNG